jgi:hypothetical protein
VRAGGTPRPVVVALLQLGASVHCDSEVGEDRHAAAARAELEGRRERRDRPVLVAVVRVGFGARGEGRERDGQAPQGVVDGVEVRGALPVRVLDAAEGEAVEEAVEVGGVVDGVLGDGGVRVDVEGVGDHRAEGRGRRGCVGKWGKLDGVVTVGGGESDNERR